MDVTIPKIYQNLATMAEATKSVFTKETMVPVSLVITFVSVVAWAIVGHTTHSNQIDVLTKENAEMKADIAKMEANFISKEMFDVRFNRIQDDISEIKDLLKNKQ